MNVDDVKRLIAYNEWANRKMVDAIGNLDRDQFTRRVESSFSSIRETLAHIIGAAWVYVRRWKGESPGIYPERSEGSMERQLSSDRLTLSARRIHARLLH